jgi:hypothetical protein
MSKTIVIPKHNNPLTVVINNTVYQYKGGETVEVPDEVAEAIEDALELVPKPKKYLSKLAQFATGTLTEITKSDLDGITTISPSAFYNYDTLQSLSIPDSVTEIGYASFGNCNALSSVILGKGVSIIGANSFECSAKLTIIDIPNRVTSIGNYAFRECWSLARVIMRPITPPTIQAETFTNLPTTCVIEVPAESVEAYKAAPFWSALASQIKAIEE